MSLDHDETVPQFLHLPVGEADRAQPVDAADLEVREIVGVVDYSLRVRLGVANAQFRLVYEQRLRRLTSLELGLTLLYKGAHALPRVLGAEEEGELVRLVL